MLLDTKENQTAVACGNPIGTEGNSGLDQMQIVILQMTPTCLVMVVHGIVAAGILKDLATWILKLKMAALCSEHLTGYHLLSLHRLVIGFRGAHGHGLQSQVSSGMT
ncbi:unnamed protein product [Arabidopsis arenosa]|uniref:Uncharacterized protein n=1 Tax=Arabidopsis arenosa TaxID=38785 RepID=A0A8S2AHL2_ARAAE|nr:unnamed protein product [Arabidopsis arenosa]